MLRVFFANVTRSTGTKVPKNMNDDEGHITLNIMQYRENGNNFEEICSLPCFFLCCYVSSYILCNIQISYIPRQLPQYLNPFYPTTHPRTPSLN